MTYRGVYVDGVVILQGEVDLRNGATVDVTQTRAKKPVRATKTQGSKSGKRTSKTARAGKSHPFLSLAGLWEGRPEWRGKSSVQIVKELRERDAKKQPISTPRKRGVRG